MTDRETLPAPESLSDKVFPVDSCPTLVVCKFATVSIIQATLFQGWEYRPVTGKPLQCGFFLHPSGTIAPIYQFGKDFSKIVKPTDIVALEGDFVPEWGYPALGVVTVTVKAAGVLLMANKYYTETGLLRMWMKELRPVPVVPALVEAAPAESVEAPTI